MDNAVDKEDLFQEITLQAWKSFGSFRGDAQFSTWLYRISLNTAITFFRKEKRKIPVLNTETLPE
jgi:RNA polymerase sigma-70 factor (ECF subfamily)